MLPDATAGVDRAEGFVGPDWFDRFANWIRDHSRGVLCAGIVFQLLMLVAMIALHSAPLVVGDRILLKVQPIDPRDLFRGDFVVLSYDFSRTTPDQIEGAAREPAWHPRERQNDAWLEDRTIYVSLEPEADGKHYRSGGVSLDRPKAGRYLKGKYARLPDGNNLHFGIEAFYVEEGHGEPLERLRNTRKLTAEIALTSWGQATLCGVK